MTRWPEMPADVAPVPGRMKGKMMDKTEIEALLDGPERLDMLAFHLRNMADGQVDGIDADRLSRAASLIVALAALQAELAASVARAEKADRDRDCFQRMTRAHWEALCAMRNSINEYIPMPNTDSGPLFSPEDGPIYADIAVRVVADIKESREYALALEQELKDRAAKTDPVSTAARRVLHDIDDLVANSEGVAGLHMNGEVADWQSIMAGGSFGAWMESVEDLRAALPEAKGEK